MIATMLFILGSTIAGYKVAEKAGILRSIPVHQSVTERSEIALGPDAVLRMKRHLSYEGVENIRNQDIKPSTNKNDKYIEGNLINNEYDDFFIDNAINIENNAIDIDSNAMDIEKNTRYSEEQIKKFKIAAKYIEIVKFKGKTSTTSMASIKSDNDIFLASPIAEHAKSDNDIILAPSMAEHNKSDNDIFLVSPIAKHAKSDNDIILAPSVAEHNKSDNDIILAPSVAEHTKSDKDIFLATAKVGPAKSDDDIFLATFRSQRPVTAEATHVPTYYSYHSSKNNSQVGTINNPGKYAKIRKISVSPHNDFKVLLKYMFS